ncbi:MAG: hypothetical protein ACRDQH_05985 [Pseudonocardiaceae bacterium]
MALLSKEAILGADDLPTQDVEVPEWGGTVRVRALSGAERDRHELRMALKAGPADADVRASMVAGAIIGEDGKRLFTDKEITALTKKSAAALDRIFDVVAELSGMTDEKVKKAVRDFMQAQNGDSPTG